MNDEKLISVVVVDDMEMIRSFISNIINNQHDMKVAATANSGIESERVIDELKGNIDIVLMDIEMDTKNDGIVSAYKIHDKYPDIKIVFLTAHNDDDLIFDSFSSGGMNYILKTSNEKELCDSIRMAYKNVSNIHPEVAQKLFKEFSRLRNNEPRLFETMSVLSNLTRSEREILKMLVNGKKTTDIARIRNVEITTMKTHINSILKKFNAKRSKDIVKIIDNLNLKNYLDGIRSE